MDVNLCDFPLDKICVGCLSSERRLEQLHGPARQYFNDILEEFGLGCHECTVVCWECAAGVRSALRLRSRVITAATTLQQHEICLQKPDGRYVNSSNPTRLQSLSRLSCETSKSVLIIAHDGHTDIATENGDLEDLIKQENDDDDVYTAEGFYVQELHSKDHVLEYKNPDINSINDADDMDTKAALKLKPCSNNKKKKGRRKVKEEEFDESDDEPLTLKKLKKENRKTKGKRKREASDAARGPGRGRGGGRGGGREQAAGVVRGAHVARRLRALGVSADQVEMRVLAWEQVEAERQRVLSSAQFGRLEHRCRACAVGFNTAAKLQHHMNKHDPSAGELECSACHIRCRTAHALAAHRRRHRVRWRCVPCGALWSRAGVAADHLARAHGAAPPTHACPLCAYVAVSLGKLRTHLKEHAGRARCELCGKSLRDRQALRTHLQIHRGIKEHVCPVAGCGKRFVFKKAMQLHADTHRPHQHLYCHQCDVTFKNQTTYYHHMKYNLKHIKPENLKHACGECSKRFHSARRLAEHRAAVHLKTTPLKCTHHNCQYACASAGRLRAHVRSVHRAGAAGAGAGGAGAGGGGRAHVCHRCGNQYTSKRSLEGHLHTHSGERPLRCPHPPCAARFAHHAALYNHTRRVHHTHKLKTAVSQATVAIPALTQQPAPSSAPNVPKAARDKPLAGPAWALPNNTSTTAGAI